MILSLAACKKETKVTAPVAVEEAPVVEPVKVMEFGFDLNNYVVKRDTIRSGDSFGEILERNNIGYPKIFQIAENAKDTFDIRRLQVGKPYTLLCSKGDSLQRPQCFIYQPNRVEYVVIDFQDSIKTYIDRKPIRIEEKTASGIISGSLYQTMVDQGLSPILAYDMSDIYAWTIDFFRIQEGDKFKVIYTEKFINDSISVGIDDIKACYFEHVGEPIYAFRFQTDSIKGIVDYFDENAKNLRRAFLKAPVQFSRISSRYNLKRRIRYYGNRIRPHRGTDFAAPVGSQILATASGTVIKSERRGGNGNYVKIKHNNTYSTQYLHMKKRKVKVGDFVKQGDVIGWVGMTGNTSGPHVCYRFWKNGREVDPFKQKLPDADPISDSLKTRYLEFIEGIKIQLDGISYPEIEELKDNEELIIDTIQQQNAITKP
ncbi:peptidoglycan DD-metalloendopeptidase family protein [Sungkyunkwania multivorans]|uniref:Peptidoglycan DD-metalloendopeptidase family protein n=1 Tax=Sungkyunkwania multivorans TaxID=1173618 RepID=A0ABW3D1I0_9FLAO